MQSTQSSLIRNSKEVRQTIDFTGVQNGKIHPTDIDAVFEFDNEVLILMEIKKSGNKIPLGQRLLLERICDSWHTDKSCVLKVEHDFYDDTKDIPLGDCYVTAVYYDGKWIGTENKPKLVSYLNRIGYKWNCPKCKF